MKNLFIQALTKFVTGLILVGVMLFLAMPLVLNSVWSFALMLLYIPIIVKRILNEEKVLEKDLAGYADYKQRVRYRLVPFVW